MAAGFIPNRSPDDILIAIDLLKPRARNLKDFATIFRAYFSNRFDYDPAAVDKFLKEGATRAFLVQLAQRYAETPEFTEYSTEQTLRAFADENRIKAGVLINGARVALTGQAVAPSLFAVMVALGKERVIERLAAAEAIPRTE